MQCYMIHYLVVIFVGVMLGKLFERYRRQKTGSRAQIVEAVSGFLKFGQYSTDLVDRRRTLFFKLSKQHQELGVETLKRYKVARQCAQANSILMNDLAQFAIKHYNITSFELAASSPGPRYRTFEAFNHFVRDFCDLTSAQRNELFAPIVANLPRISSGGSALLPGSGVGGLAFEMSKLGWQVDALEFDPCLHMAAEFAQQSSKSYSVYPWALEFSHLENAQDQTEPGIVAFNCDPNIKFEYKNFLKHQGQYDCIVTLFFIDTAENVLEYLEQIASLLKPGGTWINYGPLKWGSAPKIELSLDELKVILKTLGWTLETEWRGENRYSGAPTSMWSARYQVVGWKATRSNGA